MPLFQGIGAEVDISDKRQVHYLKKRLIPFSKSPFRTHSRDSILAPSTPSTVISPGSEAPLINRHRPVQHRTDTGSSTFVELEPDKWDDEPIGERPPSWMELSADLAWTATFSSLTSNTEISSSNTVASYTVFFTLMWQLWASQAAYDIKFYTNDWWHRLSFIIQLVIYGGLAAFTSEFDLFFKLSNEEVFVGDAVGLTAEAIRKNNERTKELSFQGIALLLSISRLFLLVQYLRVAYYRRRHKVASWLYMLTPISLFISSALFLGCFVVLKVAKPSRPTAIVQFLLWTSAILVEVLGHAFTPDDPKEKLRGHGSLTGRLSTLTVIVMGEGLNGLCATLRSTVNAVGFGNLMIVMVACTALMLYFYWLLYFDGFRERLPPRKTTKEVWLLCHWPFHLSLILFLEGLKNMLLYTNMNISTTHFIGLLMSPEVNTADGFVSSLKMEKVLQKLDLSWEQELQDVKAAFSQSVEIGQMQYTRWVLTVMVKLFKSYDESLDPKAMFYYEQYMKDDSYVLKDVAWAIANNFAGFGDYWDRVVSAFETPLVETVTWVVPVAGALLFSIGLLNYIQNRPRDKYAWGSVLNKCIGGLVMITLTATAAAKKYDVAIKIVMWRMPMISIELACVVTIDFILLYLSVRSIRRQESGQIPVQTYNSGRQYDMVQNPGALNTQQQPEPLQPQQTGQTTAYSETASLYSATTYPTTYPPIPTGYQAPSLPQQQVPPQSGFQIPPPPPPPLQTQPQPGAPSGRMSGGGTFYHPPPPPPFPGSGQQYPVTSSPVTYFPPQQYGQSGGGGFDPWNNNQR